MNIENKAINALILMGVPAGSKGFKYITDVMCLFEKNKCWRQYKIMSIYHDVAKMNNTTAYAVEKAIHYAFSNVVTKGDLEIVEKYLTLRLEKPTNGNLLSVFYIKLSQENDNEKNNN